MDYRRLGRTDLMVSAFCLGSMTWGTQNTEAEGHAQIDMSLDHGINFIDTAEMYPTNPLTKETQGDTERVIGSWIEKSGRRQDIILATKVSGKGYKNVRDGAPISAETIKIALNNSLESLKTDYVDLYQLHWPNRGSYMFRQNWTYDPSGQDSAETEDHMLEVLNALDGHIKAGRIRHIGLSNESTWGTMRWLQLAEKHNLPRMVSVQNEYSLLCRLYDTDMAEMSANEDVGLMAFSPLATGLLSGKYQHGAVPDGSRLDVARAQGGTADLGGRLTARAFEAVDAYLAIAQRHGLDPVHMALAWCRTRPFMTSAIFGATTLEQLDHALGSVEVTLSDAVLAEITTAHRAHPMPY